MDYEWSAPETWNGDRPAEMTPYVHSWQEGQKQQRGFESFGNVALDLSIPNFFATRTQLPSPEFAVSRAVVANTSGPEDLAAQFTKDIIGELDPDTVIVGVVDTGIPLGHRRSRLKNGETRILYAWQQLAKTADQEGLPLGRELFAGAGPGATEPSPTPDLSINDLLRKHSGGNLNGQLDEEAFNREARMVDPSLGFGVNDLEFASSHGAHVLDLAAGFDPLRADATKLEKVKIIAVDLPPQQLFGMGGNFLVAYANAAIQRILTVAQAVWLGQNPDRNAEAANENGYPVVINFSFGMQAGPKDGKSLWDQLTITPILNRNANIPTRLVMPTGNQNLARCNARQLLGPKGKTFKEIPLEPELSVPWCILPEDQSPNFVEIWAKAQEPEDASAGEATGKTSTDDFEVWLKPPDGAELQVPLTTHVNKFVKLHRSPLQDPEIARVYSYKPPGQTRPHFVIYVAPTFSPDGSATTAPAGMWTLRVKCNKTSAQEVTLNIQTDESGIRGVRGGRISYFDHESYLTHFDSGRLRDSYVDEDHIGEKGLKNGHAEPWNPYGPVQRKGTHNALASWPSPSDKNTHGATFQLSNGALVVVGGYRRSDGTPAIYSSTCDGSSKRKGGRETPSVLYPSDESPSQRGILAAGSRDGSVVALSGTSMACALATRDMALALLTGDDGATAKIDINEQWLQAKSHRLRIVNGLKIGKGMLDAPDTGRYPFRRDEHVTWPK